MIVAAAEMPHAAPSRHFRNQQELYAAVLVRPIAGCFAKTEDAIAMVGSVREQLLAADEVAMIAVIAQESSFGRSKEDLSEHGAPEIRETVTAQSRPPTDISLPIFRPAPGPADLS